MTSPLQADPAGRGHGVGRVLVVDNDVGDAECLTNGLRRCGYESVCVHAGRDAVGAHRDADLIVLNLELSDMDGVEVCREIRAVSEVPVIAVTARRGELDRVLVLQAGADDCLSSPYGFRELIARIEAVARRSGPVRAARPDTSLEPLRIDRATREVRKNEIPIGLTRKEFDLFCLFASEPDVVFSRRQLMMRVWGRPSTGEGRTRTLDTHINSLRHKLGAGTWIVTVHGIGFRLGHG